MQKHKKQIVTSLIYDTHVTSIIYSGNESNILNWSEFIILQLYSQIKNGCRKQ